MSAPDPLFFFAFSACVLLSKSLRSMVAGYGWARLGYGVGFMVGFVFFLTQAPTVESTSTCPPRTTSSSSRVCIYEQSAKRYKA